MKISFVNRVVNFSNNSFIKKQVERKLAKLCKVHFCAFNWRTFRQILINVHFPPFISEHVTITVICIYVFSSKDGISTFSTEKKNST